MDWKLRLTSLALAAGLFCAAPAPALAAATAGGQSWVEELMELPVVGDLLRLFSGKATDETATAETATDETATDETAATPAPTQTPAPTRAPASEPQPWAAAWMAGAVQPGVQMPQGSTEAGDPALSAQQWGSLELSSGAVLQLTSREETNLGSLAADAAAQAAAAWLWTDANQDETLRSQPVIAMLPGAAFTGNAPAGTALSALTANLADPDAALSMVAVTPRKLTEILNLSFVGMLEADTADSGYGNFPQLSGLRVLYRTTDEARQVESLWLPSTTEPEGQPLDQNDEQTTLLLVLPASQRTLYGLDDAAGYTDLLAEAGLTMGGALTALPRNLDAATLATLLARSGSTGRILPATAVSFTGVVQLGAEYANQLVSYLIDGAAATGVTDASGALALPGLAAGSHSFQMAAGEPVYYLSNLTFIGTDDAASTPVQIANVPAECLLGPAPTATPAPSAAPTATPAPSATPAATATSTPVTVTNEGHPDIADAIADGTWGAAPTATPAPEAPAPTAAPTPTQASRSTPAPVHDPTAGLLTTTPAPTLEPTPSPTASPEPTVSPEEEARREETQKTSSQLPLYIGLFVAAVCIAAVVAVLVRRKMGMGGENGTTYRRRK